MLSTFSLRPSSRSVGLGLAVATCLFVQACGPSEEITPLTPVTGKVTFDGKPYTTGQVVFNPDKEKGNNTTKVPSGSIQPDGSYTIQTGSSKGQKDGAPAGWYKVTVTPTGMSDPNASKEKAPDYNPYFKSAKMTKLTVEVKEGAPLVYEVKLTK